MLADALKELETSIGKAHESLRRELAKIRTGRANPDILDGIRIDYYGSPTPLRQVASVTVPEARMIAVKPFEKGQLQVIEKAIMTSQLNVNPQNDGEIIRIPMPPLTEERRKGLAKDARARGEDCRVAVRKARHEAKDMIDELKKSKDISEDDAERGKKQMEDIVKAGNATVDEIVAKKEADIMVV